MKNKPGYGLFEVYGVELEYMIVDRQSMKVKPVADRLIYEMTGDFVTDVDNGAIGWSNELVSHVIELKTSSPSPTLAGLAAQFHQNVKQVNGMLEKHNAMLLPTGAHPLMDPFTETHIWPHEYNQIYSLYNRLFDCRGHGWSNLQSTHLNLPFNGDEEFGRLHAAIRVLLPVMPALSASTPVLDGKNTGIADSRLEAYRKNQEKIPVLCGVVIPERAFTKQAYTEQIFTPINEAIRPYDTENILNHLFLNSRGAIARFDRGAIEIRVLDIQEAPNADLAIAEGITAVLKALTNGLWSDPAQQQAWSEHDLASILLQVIREGENAVITNTKYLELFSFPDKTATAQALWQFLFEQIQSNLSADGRIFLHQIINQGSLSSRITSRLPHEVKEEDIKSVYRELSQCLEENRLFVA